MATGTKTDGLDRAEDSRPADFAPPNTAGETDGWRGQTDLRRIAKYAGAAGHAQPRKAALMNASRKNAIREVMRLNSVSYATAKRMVDRALRLIEASILNGLSEGEISGIMKAKNGAGKAINN